jgi:hypothetical protein
MVILFGIGISFATSLNYTFDLIINIFTIGIFIIILLNSNLYFGFIVNSTSASAWSTSTRSLTEIAL